jgi:HNH endonuclease
MAVMEVSLIDEAATYLEKANGDLEPELLTSESARELLAAYARVERLAAFGKTVLARKLDDAREVARVTGTSMGKAKATVDTGKALRAADEVCDAFASGELSLDQTAEIVRAEQARQGSGVGLMRTAKEESFHVLRERARKVVLEAEQHRGLGQRQRDARAARSHTDELGMVNVNLRLEPHVGTSIVNRAEAEAARLYRKAKQEGCAESFERHLADAYAGMLSGNGKGPSRRPELVVLVSHEVVKRGWKDVREGEICKIPGVGPVAPEAAREIGQDALLTGVFYDRKDLRNVKRWTRNIPVDVLLALELGDPPEFDGIRCSDCGNRFRNQNDHVEPHVAFGPASLENLEPRCWSCHRAKTEQDRKAGKLRRGPPASVHG